MSRLIRSALAFGALMCAPIAATAQDSFPPIFTSIDWQISRNLDGNPDPVNGTFLQFAPFDPNTEVAREFDVLRFIMTIFDPDDEDDIWIARNAFWTPLSGYLTPEPPPIVEDTVAFVFALTMPPGVHTVVVFGDLSVPPFIGKSQARLRGLVDWDVRWLNQHMVANESDPEMVTPGLTIRCGQIFNGVHFWCDRIHAKENPAADPPNPPPFANAGRDLVVASGTTVELDGTDTFDSFNVGFDASSIDIFEKDRLQFVWEWTSGPERIDPFFRDPLNRPAVAEVTLNALGTYTFRLIADDGVNALPTTDSMVIEVVSIIPENRAPVAIASGPTTAVALGSVITLDGTGSFDPDGDPLGFLWQQTDELGGRIPSSEIDRFFQPLAGTDTPVSRWQTTKIGVFHFRLLVNDGEFVHSTRISIEVIESVTAGFTVVQPGAVLPTSPNSGSGDATEAAPSQPGNQFATPLCGAGLFPVMMIPFGMFLMRGRRRN